MTPLRQRFIEDMRLRGLASTTQRSYLHYVANYANFYRTGPAQLDLEAVRQYELYPIHEKKLSPESINTFISAMQFLYLVTLEMPWDKEVSVRVGPGAGFGRTGSSRTSASRRKCREDRSSCDSGN